MACQWIKEARLDRLAPGEKPHSRVVLLVLCLSQGLSALLTDMACLNICVTQGKCRCSGVWHMVTLSSSYMGTSSPALEPEWKWTNGYGDMGQWYLHIGPQLRRLLTQRAYAGGWSGGQQMFSWDMVNHYWAGTIGCSSAGRLAWLWQALWDLWKVGAEYHTNVCRMFREKEVKEAEVLSFEVGGQTRVGGWAVYRGPHGG